VIGRAQIVVTEGVRGTLTVSQQDDFHQCPTDRIVGIGQVLTGSLV
jgi:hypothetical protein